MEGIINVVALENDDESNSKETFCVNNAKMQKKMAIKMKI